jgi:hypothetical protein
VFLQVTDAQIGGILQERLQWSLSAASDAVGSRLLRRRLRGRNWDGPLLATQQQEAKKLREGILADTGKPQSKVGAQLARRLKADTALPSHKAVDHGLRYARFLGDPVLRLPRVGYRRTELID